MCIRCNVYHIGLEIMPLYYYRYERSVSALGELHRGRLNRCSLKFPEGGSALNIRLFTFKLDFDYKKNYATYWAEFLKIQSNFAFWAQYVTIVTYWAFATYWALTHGQASTGIDVLELSSFTLLACPQSCCVK